MAAPQATGAVGQIVPAGGIIGVMGAPGSVVTRIFVHPGQDVKAGTLLMSTEARSPDSDAALARKQLQAAEDLSVQQDKAQAATVALAQSRYDQAKAALDAYQGLGSIISRKEMDGYASAAADAAKSLEAEQARLRAVKSQSQSNLNAARSQLDAALSGTELRAPVDGTILKITRHPGERLGGDPAVQLGDLSAMYVVCQVYEGDLLRLRPGMSATVTAQSLPQALHGRIEEVGRMVDTQARLGEVRIRLDSPEPAARLVGMQVDVAIEH
jgi:multidrug resistance efflux pump